MALCKHDDVIKWRHFPRYWTFVRGFFDPRPNKQLSKQWWGWWFETPSSPLWRHCNETVVSPVLTHWIYHSLALSHPYIFYIEHLDMGLYLYGTKLCPYDTTHGDTNKMPPISSAGPKWLLDCTSVAFISIILSQDFLGIRRSHYTEK